MQKELNELYLRSLKPPETGRFEVSDTKRKGLRFRLSAKSKTFPDGRAVWMYEKRVKGGPKRKHTLGVWPEYSLAKARSAALEIEAEAAKGIDRVAINEAQRREAAIRRKEEEIARAGLLSVRHVIDLYSELHLSSLRTGAERKRQLEQNLTAHLDKPIAELGRKDLQAAVDSKAKEGRRIFANRIRAALLAFANWAHVRGYLETNIGAGVGKASKETARERVLSLTEVQSIWQATFDMGGLWGPMLKLLLLTGQRRGEILKLQWSEIDLEKRQIIKPGSTTKNGKPHITHLSAPAIEAVHAITRGEGKFVFSTTGKTPVSGISKMKARLDAILGPNFEPWRLHDIRTAMATALAEAGVPETIADRILNHSASGSAPSAVARVYNQAEQLPQRAMALDKWAEMVTGETAKIARIAK